MLEGNLCCIAHEHEWDCVLHFRNYSVEAFYADVPECVGTKTSRKTREIHSFSMTFSLHDFLCMEGNFHKRCILTPKVILS